MALTLPDGSTHWSTRKLGRLLKIHHNLVGKARRCLRSTRKQVELWFAKIERDLLARGVFIGE